MSGIARAILVFLSVFTAAAAATLWVIDFGVESSSFVGLVGRLRWWPLPILFACLAGHIALASWCWILIERSMGGENQDFGRAWTFGALGVALGTFLPPPLMAVTMRGLSNRLSGTSTVRGAVSGTLDQFADIAMIALLTLPSIVGIVTCDWRIFAGAALIAIGIGYAGLGMLRWLALRLASLKGRVQGNVADLSLLRKVFVISLIRVINLTVLTLLILLAIGIGDAEAIVVGVPVISFAISLAMLPGALGVSEWSFSVVFARFGVPREEIVLFVLANRLLLTSVSLVLGLIAVGLALAAARRAKVARRAAAKDMA